MDPELQRELDSLLTQDFDGLDDVAKERMSLLLEIEELEAPQAPAETPAEITAPATAEPALSPVQAPEPEEDPGLIRGPDDPQRMFDIRPRDRQGELVGPAAIPDPFTTIADIGRDVGVNVARLPFDVAELFGSERAGDISSTIGRTVPDFAEGTAEEIASGIGQFAIPGVAAARGATAATQGAPRLVQIISALLGGGAAEVAVADPETEGTLGDIVRAGPTQTEPGEPGLARRAKVGAEGLALGGAGEAIAPVARFGGKVAGEVGRSVRAQTGRGQEVEAARLLQEAAGRPVQREADFGQQQTERVPGTIGQRRLRGDTPETAAITEAAQEAEGTGFQPSVAEATQSPGIAEFERGIGRTPGSEAQRRANIDVAQQEISRATQAPAGASPEQARQQLARAQEEDVAPARQAVEEAGAGAAGARAELGEQAEELTGGPLTQGVSQRAQASERLAEQTIEPTRQALESQRRAKFAAVDPEGVTRREGTELQTELGAIRPEPGLEDEFASAKTEIDKLTGGFEGTFTPSLRFLINRRRVVGDKIAKATRDGDGALAEQLRQVEGAIDSEIGRFDAEGLSAELTEANRFFKEEVAPRFREGEGAKLTKEARAGGSTAVSARPERIAERFLKTDRSPAAQLRSIIAAAPNPKQAEKQVRDFIVADMASLAVKNGELDAGRLKAFRDSRADVLAQFPAIRREINATISKAEGATKRVTDFETAAKEAAQGLKQIEAEQKLAAATTFIKGDQNPIGAVNKIMRGNNPAGDIKQLKSQVARDTSGDAERGLQVAYREWAADQLKLNPGDLRGSLKRMDDVLGNEQRRAAMSELFDKTEMGQLDRARTFVERMLNADVSAKVAAETKDFGQGQRLLRNFLMLRNGAIKGRLIFSVVSNVAKLGGADAEAGIRRILESAVTDPEAARVLLLMDTGAPPDQIRNRLRAYLANNLIEEAAGRDQQERE